MTRTRNILMKIYSCISSPPSLGGHTRATSKVLLSQTKLGQVWGFGLSPPQTKLGVFGMSWMTFKFPSCKHAGYACAGSGVHAR